VSISLVIVTYQPNIETLSSLVLGNLDYLNQIIIVDNASHNAEEIFNLSENNKK
jgi:GT2 family glycosyltransferase